MNAVAGVRAAPSSAAPAVRQDFGQQLQAWQTRMESALAQRLPAAEVVPERLHEAMRYTVLGGGKRIRPALLFAAAMPSDAAKTKWRALPAPLN